MFDPCGTRRLEGEDILKRAAEYLKLADDKELKNALIYLVELYKKKQEGQEIIHEFRDSY